MADAATGAPSPWFEAQRERIAEAARTGPVLDLACGSGRHAREAARCGWPTVAVDRDSAALKRLASATPAPLIVRVDVEDGNGIPFATETFGAILVFRFLFRPLAPELEAALRPGGLLVYETFTRAQRAHGWGPSRGAFLLEPGELPTLFPGLEVVAHEEPTTRGNRPESVARLAARKPR